MELALREGQIGQQSRRVGPGNSDGAREFVAGLFQAAHANMLHGEVVVGIRILRRDADGFFEFFHGLFGLAGFGESLCGGQRLKCLSVPADGAIG